MEFSGQRPCLSDYQVSRTGSFCASVILSIFILASITACFAIYVFPKLKEVDLLVSVISTPPLPEDTLPPPEPAHTPFRVKPLPTPPVQAQIPPPPPPVAPLLVAEPEVETDFLVSTSDEALEEIARFEEEQQRREQEILEEEERSRKAAEEAALLAEQKAAEEEARRKAQAQIRAAAAREEEARRAQQRAIAAREAEARRAQEQATAAREAQARQAQEQANREAAALAAQKEAERRAAAANAAAAKQVASRPALKKSSTPNYPKSARSKGQQGTAKVQVTVTSSGKVSSPRLITSSGHRALDSSALAAVKRYRFYPAKNGLGQAISYPVVIPITFRLN